MFRIPESFRDEEYITIPPMKKFISSANIAIGKSFYSRPECLEAIEEYANSSDQALEETLYWLDSILKAGIKDVYMTYFESEKIPPSLYCKASYYESILQKHVPNRTHLCDGKNNDQLSIKSFNISETEQGLQISIIYVRKAVYFEIYSQTKKVLLYPLFVDIS